MATASASGGGAMTANGAAAAADAHEQLKMLREEFLALCHAHAGVGG